jgi:hypothetical protein
MKGDENLDDEPKRPTHLTRTLWRYMSFAKFLWLIQNKKLWLARADTLNDPWELALAGDQLDYVILRRPITPLGPKTPEEPIRERAIRINKEWRETTFISCWSSADHESYALWKLFCGSNDGVAIAVATRSLGLALGNVKLYVVTYDKPGTTLRTPSALDLATKKRLMFEYEREVRAIATVDTPNPKLGKGEFGFTYDIEPEELIFSIAVHPEADSTLMDAVMRAVDDYVPKLRDKVTWSAMREPPPLLRNNRHTRFRREALKNLSADTVGPIPEIFSVSGLPFVIVVESFLIALP